MRKPLPRVRFGIVVAALAAFSVPLLTPAPASAGWYGPGWGNGWHRGCCWRPRVAAVPPAVVYASPPPVVYAPPPVAGRVWIRPHWNGPYWVPGHWG